MPAYADFRERRDRGITLSKSSGKVAPFMLWLTCRGRKLFEQAHNGRNYNAGKAEDQEYITRLWKSLSQEEKDQYKNNAKAQNENKDVVEQRRHAANKKHRQAMLENAEDHYEYRAQHREYLEAERRRNLQEQGPIHVLPRVKMDTFTRRGFEEKRFNKLRLLTHRLNFFMKNDPHASHLEGKRKVRSLTCVLMTVYPFTVAKFKGGLIVHPAEISLMEFSLEHGVKNRKYFLVNFDCQFLFNLPEVPYWNKEVLQEFETNIGMDHSNIDERAAFNPSDLSDVWHELINFIQTVNPQILLCDARQYNWVVPTLSCLANTNINAERDKTMLFVNEKITDQLFCIQDFCKALMSVTLEMPSLNDVLDASIEQEFSRVMIPRPGGACSFHETKPLNSLSKLVCPSSVAHGQLHILFSMCHHYNIMAFKDDNIYGSRHYFSEIHKSGGDLQKNFVAYVMEEEEQSRRDETAGDGNSASHQRSHSDDDRLPRRESVEDRRPNHLQDQHQNIIPTSLSNHRGAPLNNGQHHHDRRQQSYQDDRQYQYNNNHYHNYHQQQHHQHGNQISPGNSGQGYQHNETIYHGPSRPLGSAEDTMSELSFLTNRTLSLNLSVSSSIYPPGAVFDLNSTVASSNGFSNRAYQAVVPHPAMEHHYKMKTPYRPVQLRDYVEVTLDKFEFNVSEEQWNAYESVDLRHPDRPQLEEKVPIREAFARFRNVLGFTEWR